MCPACIATAAWIAAGAGSAGGLTAFVFARRRPRKDARKSDESHSRVSMENATNATRASQPGSGS
jgi:hypothetical protein